MDLRLFRAAFARVSDAYGLEMPSGRPKAERKPLTDDLLRDHLVGKIRVGAYTTDVEGLADQIIIDIDIPKERAGDLKEWDQARMKAKRVHGICDEIGVEAFITSSKSRGYHVRALWDPAPAAVLKKGGEYLSRRAGVQAEVFPKQDKRPEDGLGNFVWLPLHGASLGAGKTAILATENGLDPLPDQWEALRGVKRNSYETLAVLQALAEDNEKEMGIQAPPTRKILNQVTEGMRRDSLTSLAGSMRRRGLTETEILPTLLAVNRERCVPPVPEKEVAAIAKSIERYKPEPSAASPSKAEDPRASALEAMQPRTVLDLLSDSSLTSPEEVFEGLIAVGEVTVLGGPPKAMKSWTIKSIGLAAAAGGSWLGFEATRPFRVLLLSAEGRETRLRERFQKLIAFSEIEEEGLQRMAYVSTGGKLKIDTPEGERTLMRLVEPYEVVILDPVYRFISEGDENSHKDARRVQDVLDRVKEAGKCVLLVHHVRKAVAGVNSGISELRGAGLDGFVDGAMMLSRTREDSDEKFKLDFTLRNFEDPPAMELARDGVILIPATKKTYGVMSSNIPPIEIERILESFGGEMPGKQLYAQIRELKNVSQATAERAVVFATSPLVGSIGSRPSGGKGNGRVFFLVKHP